MGTFLTHEKSQFKKSGTSETCISNIISFGETGVKLWYGLSHMGLSSYENFENFYLEKKPASEARIPSRGNCSSQSKVKLIIPS